MEKWEYVSVYLKGNGQTSIDILNRYGQMGWELVCIDDYGYAIFKRRKV